MNVLGFAAFLVFLRTQAVPGEIVDVEAALFGVAAYGVFASVEASGAARRAGAHPAARRTRE